MHTQASGGFVALNRAAGLSHTLKRAPVEVREIRPAPARSKQVVVSVSALAQRDRTKLRCATVLAQSRLLHAWRISDVDDESHCRIVPPRENSSDGYIELVNAAGNRTVVELDWPLTEESVTRALNQAGSHVVVADSQAINPRKSWVASLLGRASQQPRRAVEQAAPDRGRVSGFLERFGLRKEKAPFNVLFVGPPASGKTTAILTASTIPARTTEASATDDVATMKARTTISIDYGECPLGDLNMRMFGTPGQLRFAHMIENTRKSADAAILLMDMSSPDPLGDIVQYLDYLEGFGDSRGRPLIVGLTHIDEGRVPKNFHAALTALLGKRAPVVPLDPRNRGSVLRALTALSGLSTRAVATA